MDQQEGKTANGAPLLPGVAGKVHGLLSRESVRVIADLLLVAAIVVLSKDEFEPAWEALIGVPMAVALVFRRRWPVPVMGFVAVLALAQVGAGLGLNVYDVALVIAMAAVVTYSESARAASAAGGAVWLYLTVDHFARGRARGGVDNWVEYVTLVSIVGVVWLAAYVMKTRRMYVAALEARGRAAEQLGAAEERAGIARELHDVVAHSLAVMIVQADGAYYAFDGDRDGAREAVRTIADTGREALEDMRRIVGVLRGGHTPDAGDRNSPGLHQLESVIDRARSAGLRVELRAVGASSALSAADELTVLRLVQEALTNTLRHAGTGAAVTIDLDLSDSTAVVEVVDDGAGRIAAPPAPGRTGGNGLVGMRERVAVHGGQLTVGPRSGPGWRVRAIVPIRAAQ